MRGRATSSSNIEKSFLEFPPTLVGFFLLFIFPLIFRIFSLLCDSLSHYFSHKFQVCLAVNNIHHVMSRGLEKLPEHLRFHQVVHDLTKRSSQAKQDKATYHSTLTRVKTSAAEHVTRCADLILNKLCLKVCRAVLVHRSVCIWSGLSKVPLCLNGSK